MDGDCTHREYWAQFVTEETRNTVLVVIGKKKLLKAQNDEHLNSIPLENWDRMPISINTKLLIAVGDSYSLSVRVCIGKEAARQVIEGLNK